MNCGIYQSALYKHFNAKSILSIVLNEYSYMFIITKDSNMLEFIN